jgi:hypothetical protein
VHLGPLLDEQRHHVHSLVPSCGRQRVVVPTIPHVRIGSMIQQELYYCERGILGRVVQWSKKMVFSFQFRLRSRLGVWVYSPIKDGLHLGGIFRGDRCHEIVVAFRMVWWRERYKAPVGDECQGHKGDHGFPGILLRGSDHEFSRGEAFARFRLDERITGVKDGDAYPSTNSSKDKEKTTWLRYRP